MAPFSKATQVSYVSEGLYTGKIDADWTVGAVPNGGYLLALIVEACIGHQSTKRHHDPIHVTAQYLRTSSIAPFRVRVRTLKTGRSFSNIVAELLQKGQVNITTHIIFGVLAPSSDGPGLRLTITPPSRYARRIPLYSHPSQASVVPMVSTWVFNPHVRWADDLTVLSKNEIDGVNRTDSDTVGGGGLEWAAWFEFIDIGERITTPSLAFLVDIFRNLPQLLPKSERIGLTTSWFPTMALSIEFKFPIPSSPDHATRTVGVYSSGRFLNDPQGRHDAYVEVWTAPRNIGEGNVSEGWRDKQVCLAIATQMALTIPIEVNLQIGQKTAKL